MKALLSKTLLMAIQSSNYSPADHSFGFTFIKCTKNLKAHLHKSKSPLAAAIWSIVCPLLLSSLIFTPELISTSRTSYAHIFAATCSAEKPLKNHSVTNISSNWELPLVSKINYSEQCWKRRCNMRQITNSKKKNQKDNSVIKWDTFPQ